MEYDELMKRYYDQKPLYSDLDRFNLYKEGKEVDFLPYQINGIQLAIISNLGYKTS